jgi:hypothetical protein
MQVAAVGTREACEALFSGQADRIAGHEKVAP